jgi:uncharacterized protein
MFAKLQEHLALLRQMIFLVGPRQVGKTTLAQALVPQLQPGLNYFNWDHPAHKRLLLQHIFPGRQPLTQHGQEIVVFDEIHKYPRWKNTLKGLFDTHEPNAHWIVTGSAALNVYRRGQDSLLGRSFTYHLHPFSVAEVTNAQHQTMRFDDLLSLSFALPTAEQREAFDQLMALSGFPEPFLKGTPSFLTRWRNTRLDRLINQDLGKTEVLRNLALVEQLMYLLPERVGSPLSINSLREDLEVHFATAKHWLQLLERVFYGFHITPFTKKRSRMLKKETKWYLWDWTEIDDMGVRFENCVAVHLLKYVQYLNDLGHDDLSLHYVRDKSKREVDFLICRKRKPQLLIECKHAPQEPSKALLYFKEYLQVPKAVQLHAASISLRQWRQEYAIVETIPAASFLSVLV